MKNENKVMNFLYVVLGSAMLFMCLAPALMFFTKSWLGMHIFIWLAAIPMSLAYIFCIYALFNLIRGHLEMKDKNKNHES